MHDQTQIHETADAPIAPPPLTHARMEAFTHNLASTLHQSLDPATVISLFLDRIRTHVRYSGYRFANAECDIRIEEGRCDTKAVSYALTLGGQTLGELVIARERPFGATEAYFMESTIAALLYPLRNALLYHAATRAAFKDPLTGVNNRSSFQDALEREIGLARRHGSPFSLVMVDIDHFKEVNDRHGHVVGDTALCAVAGAVETCMRSTDILYRYGGEEFVGLLPNTDLEGARHMAERARQAVEAHPCPHRDEAIALTISVGVASLRPDESARLLFDRVDRALYRAKDAGRNRLFVDDAPG